MRKKLIDNPILKKQWHPTRNSSLNKSQITIGSEKKVWWLCEKNPGHEWETTVNARHHGKRGCPFCSGHRRDPKKTFSSEHPELLRFWDIEKNIGINPKKELPTKNTKIWWVCEKGHSYQNTISERLRTTRQGCPYCSGKLVIEENSLTKNFPELVSEWHWEKNRKSPEEYTKSSGKVVWWICPRGHEYRAPIDRRTINHSSCRKCRNHISIPHARIYSELKPIFPKSVIHAKLEGYEVDIFIPELNLVIEYDGQFFHKNRGEQDRKKTKTLEKKYRVLRVREPDLPAINSEFIVVEVGLKPRNIVDIFQKINDPKLLTAAKTLKKEGFQNTDLFSEVISERYVPDDASLKLHPALLNEWDPIKNHPLRPENFSQHSNAKVFWKCLNDHFWEASINNRVGKKSGCPYCSGRLATADNNVKALRPDLIEFWDKDTNDYLPEKLLPNSNVKINWVCEKKHKFSRKLSDVTIKGLGCPYCSGRYASRENNLSSDNISVLWFDYERNQPDLPSNFTLNSGQKIHWKCPLGHQFVKTIFNFRKAVNKCPECFSVGTKYHFIRSDGVEFYGTQSNFCKNYSLNQSEVSALTKGKRKTHKGWKLRD